MFAAIRGASLRVISLVAFRRPGSSSKYTHASAIASPHDVTGGSTFPLVQKRKPVWNAPMLDQPKELLEQLALYPRRSTAIFRARCVVPEAINTMANKTSPFGHDTIDPAPQFYSRIGSS